MQAKYYEPMFYISSEKMPFTIRVEIKLTDDVDGNQLKTAVNKAMERYPYFAMRVIRQNEEYLTEKNALPVVVYAGSEVYALGSKEVNYHMVALSYSGNQINFFTSHVITDGGGFFPFIKTVLYYYHCEKTGTILPSDGVNLATSAIGENETGDFFELNGKTPQPFYIKRCDDCFKLKDGGYVKENDEGRIFRFKIPAKETMTFSYDNDGSPNALLSALTAKAIWAVHPSLNKSIASAVSFNFRPFLKKKSGWGLMSDSLLVEYPAKLKDRNVLKICTVTRGTIALQTQPENAEYFAWKRKQLFDGVAALKTLEERKKFVGDIALKDSVNNTFSISYVGKVDYGSVAPYIAADYNITDGSTYQTLFVEIGAVNGWFTIAFIQGFSSDVYYKALLNEIKNCNIPYVEEGITPLVTPKILLP